MTRTLAHLQEEGLVEHHRHDADTADYRLTAAGTELVDLLADLEQWTRLHRSESLDEADR
jgi:DNA-binding HxlR family transcriptional regulator